MKTKIRLQVSRLLNNRFELQTDGLQKKFELLNLEFVKKEEIIIDGLKKITGLTFLRNYIDVFVINPDNRPAISFPIIVKANENIERTICIIIHELIHNLMWDNTEKDSWSLKVQELFKEENPKTAIHISVHAIMEALYVEILKNPGEIEKDIEIMGKYPDYKRAWEIVKKEGYQTIINKLKK